MRKRTDKTQKVKPSEILEELKPLMDDYFSGDISFDGKAITYRLPSGESILIIAKYL